MSDAVATILDAPWSRKRTKVGGLLTDWLMFIGEMHEQDTGKTFCGRLKTAYNQSNRANTSAG
eukprot:1154811-Pelagomonas_calceolata.AAC.3